MKRKKLTIQMWLSVFLIFVGVLLLIVGLMIPPIGVIDSSVLIAYGEVSTFAGSLIGVDYKYAYAQFKDSLNHKIQYNDEDTES